MKDTYKIIELFAGIGGFRLAADELGLKSIWANDISPISSTVYRDRFGHNGFIEGDIRSLLSEVPQHDILTAGFPCQPFSSAGKKEGVRDPRGTLFESIVNIALTRQPRFFVLENVKRLLSMEHGEHFATVLSALSELGYFIEWRLLNAKDFSLAQHRERVVILGTRLPEELLADTDILHLLRLATVGEISQSSKKSIHGLSKLTNWRSLSHHGARFSNWGMAYKGAFIGHDLVSFMSAKSQVLLKDILEQFPLPKYDLTETTLHRLVENEVVDKFYNGVEIISNQAGGAKMGYTIFGVKGLAPTLTASTSRHYERYFVNGRYRRLTPVEYARLQGFPDDHCRAARPYDQYSLLGNAAPPPMVKWVLEKLLIDSQLQDIHIYEAQQDLFYA